MASVGDVTREHQSHTCSGLPLWSRLSVAFPDDAKVRQHAHHEIPIAVEVGNADQAVLLRSPTKVPVHVRRWLLDRALVQHRGFTRQDALALDARLFDIIRNGRNFIVGVEDDLAGIWRNQTVHRLNLFGSVNPDAVGREYGGLGLDLGCVEHRLEAAAVRGHHHDLLVPFLVHDDDRQVRLGVLASNGCRRRDDVRVLQVVHLFFNLPEGLNDVFDSPRLPRHLGIPDALRRLAPLFELEAVDPHFAQITMIISLLPGVVAAGGSKVTYALKNVHGPFRLVIFQRLVLPESDVAHVENVVFRRYLLPAVLQRVAGIVGHESPRRLVTSIALLVASQRIQPRHGEPLVVSVAVDLYALNFHLEAQGQRICRVPLTLNFIELLPGAVRQDPLVAVWQGVEGPHHVLYELWNPPGSGSVKFQDFLWRIPNVVEHVPATISILVA
mmetsp:Transcript_67599/g.207052  ORF Transcript_67599/g.207052 Transcript_67599/m.207052 type:complete len:442 (-) Transcript_67599:320-1645(-)